MGLGPRRYARGAFSAQAGANHGRHMARGDRKCSSAGWPRPSWAGEKRELAPGSTLQFEGKTVARERPIRRGWLGV